MKQVINNANIKAFYKSKTLWVNVIMALLAISEFLKENMISPGYVFMFGLINVVLRFITTESIALKSQ
jgi:Mg2+/citrate symporter